jgi:hypothetical protein
MSRVRSSSAIHYAPWFSIMADEPVEAIVRAFGEQFSKLWIEGYHRMCDGPTNVLEVPLNGFAYLFDFCSELIDAGELPIDAREDRIIGAYGISQSAGTSRDTSRIRGFPGSDERGDRASGGGLDINVFHQNVYLNRGWSPAGKRYRDMERYCVQNKGTFFFSRLLYSDATARPPEIEFGILKMNRTLWLEVFENTAAA